MKISKKIIATLLVLTMVLGAAFGSQVIVSPRAEDVIREYTAVPSSVLEQLGVAPVDGPNSFEFQAATDLKVASTDPGYLVTPGDIISVSYLEKTGARPMTVLLSVPVSGELKLGSIASFETEGKTFQGLKSEIENALLNYSRYSEPQVNLADLGLFTVSVKGEVLTAKTVRVNGLSKLSDLMYLAGPNASTRRVTVTDRNGAETEYDMFDAMRNGNGDENRSLRPGDVITFTPSERTVVISGAVKMPGTYQLLEGENLQSLLNVYCKGIAPSAGSSIIIERVGENATRETIELGTAEETVLKNGDVIFLEPALTSNASVSIEGALGMPAAGRLGAQNQKYFFKYAVGETVYDMVLVMSELFGQDSDLENAYLIRNGEKIMLDFSDILFGEAEEGRMALQSGDRFFVPFVQMTVTVLGGVRNPGVYGYVPGKTADYYINLAGGYTALSKEAKGTTITDRTGAELGMDDPLSPESLIEVEQDETQSNLSSTVAVLGVVTSVLGIVSTIIGITTAVMNAAK